VSPASRPRSGLNARPAEEVSRIPREEVLFMNFGNLRPPTPHAARVAHGALLGYTRSGHVVRAVAVVLVADTLTTITLRTPRANAYLVGSSLYGTGRDEPTTCA